MCQALKGVTFILSIILFGEVTQYYSHFTNAKPEAWWNLKVATTQKFAECQIDEHP